jgi:hypothetical protein
MGNLPAGGLLATEHLHVEGMLPLSGAAAVLHNPQPWRPARKLRCPVWQDRGGRGDEERRRGAMCVHHVAYHCDDLPRGGKPKVYVLSNKGMPFLGHACMLQRRGCWWWRAPLSNGWCTCGFIAVVPQGGLWAQQGQGSPTCTVLPSPISSARMPLRPWSASPTIQQRPWLKRESR